MFRWSQNRSSIEYVNEKIDKLCIIDMIFEKDIIIRIYKDLQYVSELQLSITTYNRLIL